MDERHLRLQFQYITNCQPLNSNIEENLRTSLGHLEKYLRDVFKTVEFKSELEKIELVCQLEFAGSTQFKDIFILRKVCEHFDQQTDGSMLVRLSCPESMESDPQSDNPSPHLVAVLVDKTFIFEIWAEAKKLLGNMDLATALAGFFHLCFCFDLKYPKGGETAKKTVALLGDEEEEPPAKKKGQGGCPG